MNWTDIRRLLTGKLKSSIVAGGKHDTSDIFCGESHVGTVLISRGRGELTSREIGNIARSLRLNEYKLKALERCDMSREAFCAEVSGKIGAKAN